MMETEEKYKVVIVDDERSAIDALRHELEPYSEFEVKGMASNGTKITPLHFDFTDYKMVEEVKSWEIV